MGVTGSAVFLLEFGVISVLSIDEPYFQPGREFRLESRELVYSFASGMLRMTWLGHKKYIERLKHA